MYMTRRSLVMISCAFAMLFWAGCASTRTTTSTTMTQDVRETGDKTPPFIHCVFFTLKPGTTDDQIEEFIRDCHSLKAVPSVRKLVCGRRDERMQRDVNITDYQIGLVVYFDDKAGHDAYSEHPMHNKLIEKHKDQWSSVRVFDFDARQ